MTGIKLAQKKNTTYENFEAECPYCNAWNIHNRVSDLGTTEPIAGMDVSCFKCKNTYRLTGDWINPAFEMLIYECYDLKENKRYMNCVLNLCQACEMFFNTFLRTELVYRPFARGNRVDLNPLNSASKKLWDKTQSLSYKDLRNIFLNLVISDKYPANLDEAITAIDSLESLKNDPKNSDIQKIPNVKLTELFLQLKKSTVNTERNKVVHQRGYRPHRDEVEKLLDETYNIIFRLAALLRIQTDDSNMLVNFAEP